MVLAAAVAQGFARAEGVGLPERSEPEGPQGAERGPPTIATAFASAGFLLPRRACGLPFLHWVPSDHPALRFVEVPEHFGIERVAFRLDVGGDFLDGRLGHPPTRARARCERGFSFLFIGGIRGEGFSFLFSSVQRPVDNFQQPDDLVKPLDDLVHLLFPVECFPIPHVAVHRGHALNRRLPLHFRFFGGGETSRPHKTRAEADFADFRFFALIRKSDPPRGDP